MARPSHPDGLNNYAQHLTWTTRGRDPHFQDPNVAEMCLIAMEKERSKWALDVYGYCLMPDHMHLVVGPGDDSPGKIVQVMKMASNWWLQAFGLVDRSPWARGYWDRAICSNAELLAALRYLHNNPVKAGLASSLEEYPFTSYAYYHEGKPPLIWLSKFS